MRAPKITKVESTDFTYEIKLKDDIFFYYFISNLSKNDLHYCVEYCTEDNNYFKIIYLDENKYHKNAQIISGLLKKHLSL